MEIKKSASPVSTIVQQSNSAETEKKSVKSSAVGITSAKDAFEVVKNNNGLFSENLGRQELSPAEQQGAFKLDYKDFQNFRNSSSSQRQSK